jgi:hypothetical protein
MKPDRKLGVIRRRHGLRHRRYKGFVVMNHRCLGAFADAMKGQQTPAPGQFPYLAGKSFGTN